MNPDIEKIKEELWKLHKDFNDQGMVLIEKEKEFKQSQIDLETMEANSYLKAKAKNTKLTIAELESMVEIEMQQQKLETLKKESEYKKEKLNSETIAYRIQLIRSLSDIVVSENYGTNTLHKIDDKRSF